MFCGEFPIAAALTVEVRQGFRLQPLLLRIFSIISCDSADHDAERVVSQLAASNAPARGTLKISAQGEFNLNDSTVIL